MTQDDDQILTNQLREQGLSEIEIQKVLSRLDTHDDRTFRDAIFNSIESGTFDLKSIVEDSQDEEE